MKIPQGCEKCYEKGAWVMKSVMEIMKSVMKTMKSYEKCYENYEKSYEKYYVN